MGMIEQMYGYGATVFPYGIKLRYVPCFDKNISSSIISLKIRQERYTEKNIIWNIVG